MQPLAVDLQILRSLLLPDARIAPGRALMARVASADGSGHGSLSIAGFVLEAELPKHVRAGQSLRLVVRDVSSERVLLSLSDPQATPPAPATPPAVTLPGGGTVTVSERDGAGGGGSSPPSHTLSLRYDAPALGAVDLRFELVGGSLRVAVVVAAGEPLALAQAAAGDLQESVAQAVTATVGVTVAARREPLEIYA